MTGWASDCVGARLSLIDTPCSGMNHEDDGPSRAEAHKGQIAFVRVAQGDRDVAWR